MQIELFYLHAHSESFINQNMQRKLIKYLFICFLLFTAIKAFKCRIKIVGIYLSSPGFKKVTKTFLLCQAIERLCLGLNGIGLGRFGSGF